MSSLLLKDMYETLEIKNIFNYKYICNGKHYYLFYLWIQQFWFYIRWNSNHYFSFLEHFNIMQYIWSLHLPVDLSFTIIEFFHGVTQQKVSIKVGINARNWNEILRVLMIIMLCGVILIEIRNQLVRSYELSYIWHFFYFVHIYYTHTIGIILEIILNIISYLCVNDIWSTCMYIIKKIHVILYWLRRHLIKLSEMHVYFFQTRIHIMLHFISINILEI